MAETEVGGTRLKKGTSLLVSPWHMHRDPRHWPEPERFDAERSHATPAYMPFGVGPRACVGIGLAMLEIQILVLELAAAFDVQAETSAPSLTPKASVTLIPPPISVRLSVRVARRRDEPPARSLFERNREEAA